MKVRAALLPAVIMLAGCGGDDGGGGGPSSEEYISKADAICAKADRDQTAAGAKPGQGIYDHFSDAAFLARYNAVTRDALKQLTALEAPSEERQAVAQFLAAVKASIASVDKQIAALRARNLPDQSEANREFQAAYGNVASSAGAVGLTRCQALGN